MNRHQIAGRARKLKGTIMERTGRLIGNVMMEHNGAAERSAGRFEKRHGDAQRNLKKLLHRRMSRGSGAAG